MTFKAWSMGVAAAAGLLAGTAQAVLVTVGNPGNAPDDTSYGSVPYEYRISQFEVTAGEWRSFLNTVDPTGANEFGLYSPRMDSDSFGCQITLNGGNPNGSKYDFSGGTVEAPGSTASDWQNRPVNYVSWYDAARYTNWLTTGNTESGVYDTSTWAALPHATAAATLGVSVAYFIPTEDEWYKAAYFDPSLNGGLGGYYDYPTGSDTAPSNQLVDPDPGNNATFHGDTTHTIVFPYWRTEVGAHENSGSPYGTFDQGGNVWEWNETLVSGSSRGVRGGSFNFLDFLMRADFRLDIDPTNVFDNFGFRVASSAVVPEPASGLLLAVLAGLCAARRRRA